MYHSHKTVSLFNYSISERGGEDLQLQSTVGIKTQNPILCLIFYELPSYSAGRDSLLYIFIRIQFKGLFPYYVISYNKQGSFQMITKDYSKGPRVVGKDYVLWKIQSMQESATMPHAHVFCCTPQC